jgi:hypothetical protein
LRSDANATSLSNLALARPALEGLVVSTASVVSDETIYAKCELKQHSGRGTCVASVGRQSSPTLPPFWAAWRIEHLGLPPAEVLYFFSLSGIRYGVGAVPDLFTASIIPAKGAITSLKVLSFEKRTSLFNYGFRLFSDQCR